MRVLYATDGSPAAGYAGTLIEALADRDRTRLTVLSVATPPSHVRLRSAQDRRLQAEKAATEATDALRNAGFVADADVLEGPAAEVIVERSADHDLVAVGSGSHSWIAGRLLGSVSTRALQRSPSSVLIVHEPPPAGQRHVVFGADGSADAAHALETAMNLLDPRRCEVVVVSVAELLAPTLLPPYVAHATSAPAEVELEVTESALGLAQEAVERLKANGFDASPHVVLGHPLRRLLTEAEQLEAALVVVGSRGLSPPERVVLGSVSDQLARHAPATLVGRRRSSES